jgi:phage terminase Nu1 subunit (DNA packaging protein)
MTRNELMKSLDVSKDTTFRWQKLGMPKTKMLIKGIQWRWDFDITEIKLWLENRRADYERDKARYNND